MSSILRLGKSSSGSDSQKNTDEFQSSGFINHIQQM
jgi:hypothetical protein